MVHIMKNLFLLLLLCTPVFGTLFPGTVVTGTSVGAAALGSSLMVVEIALIANSGTPSVSYESSDWLGTTVTDNGTGDSSVSFNTGIFSVAPICNCTVINASGTTSSRSCGFNETNTISTSRILTYTQNDTGAGVTDVSRIDNDFYLTCYGIR